MSALAPVVPALLAALLPKCPACIAVYFAALGGIGAELLPAPYIWPATYLSLAVGLILILRMNARRNHFAPAVLAIAGAATVLASRWLDGPSYTAIAGVVLLMAGSAWTAAGQRPLREDTERPRCAEHRHG